MVTQGQGRRKDQHPRLFSDGQTQKIKVGDERQEEKGGEGRGREEEGGEGRREMGGRGGPDFDFVSASGCTRFSSWTNGSCFSYMFSDHQATAMTEECSHQHL